jgi:hypothetical protein
MNLFYSQWNPQAVRATARPSAVPTIPAVAPKPVHPMAMQPLVNFAANPSLHGPPKSGLPVANDQTNLYYSLWNPQAVNPVQKAPRNLDYYDYLSTLS